MASSGNQDYQGNNESDDDKWFELFSSYKNM